MSVFQFLASDMILDDVKNEKVLLLSVKEAEEKGIQLNQKLISNIDRYKEGTILYFQKREDLGEIEISLEKEPYLNNYTNRKYSAVLQWDYTEQRAEQLIAYIKKHLEKAKEIELWEIWLDEKTEPYIKCCKLSELDNEKIKFIFGNHCFEMPKCLKIIADRKC